MDNGLSHCPSGTTSAKAPSRNKEPFEAGIEQATEIQEEEVGSEVRLAHAGLQGVCKDLSFFSESPRDLNK